MRRRLLLLPPLLAFLVVMGYGLLLGAGLHAYQRLTAETPVARLTFERRGPRTFEATLWRGDFCTPEVYGLHGDQWRLDARFLKWEAWANLLGLDAHYRLERLSGRYAAVEAENRGPRTAHALDDTEGLDLARLARHAPRWLLPVDTVYGSSAYAPVDPRFEYTVHRSQSGLVVRKRARSPGSVRGGVLTIRIEDRCRKPPGLWQRTTGWMHSILG